MDASIGRLLKHFLVGWPCSCPRSCPAQDRKAADDRGSKSSIPTRLTSIIALWLFKDRITATEHVTVSVSSCCVRRQIRQWEDRGSSNSTSIIALWLCKRQDDSNRASQDLKTQTVASVAVANKPDDGMSSICGLIRDTDD